MGPERTAPDRTGREAGWQPPRTRRAWHTDDVSVRERFAYYREAICEAFMELLPEQPRHGPDGFAAQVETTPIAEGAVNRVHCSPHIVRRTRTEIARSPDACYYLNLELDGECIIQQDGNEVRLVAGTVGIFDSARPFTLLHPRNVNLHVASFWVPHERFARLGLEPDALNGRLLSGHPRLGPVIVEATRALATAGRFMAETEVEALFDSLIRLSAIAACADPADAVLERHAARPALLRAILAHIEARLDDPTLSVAMVAARFGIGKRYLHRLFEPMGTSFAAYVADRRLERVAADLNRPDRGHLSIAAIAYDAGFGDLSGFNRRFKARYRCTPSEMRAGR